MRSCGSGQHRSAAGSLSALPRKKFVPRKSAERQFCFVDRKITKFSWVGPGSSVN